MSSVILHDTLDTSTLGGDDFWRSRYFMASRSAGRARVDDRVRAAGGLDAGGASSSSSEGSEYSPER